LRTHTPFTLLPLLLPPLSIITSNNGMPTPWMSWTS
jgi:hypothetical protein